MKEKIRPLYLQILFTLLAFTVMVVLSYTFNGRTVRENLSRNAESVLTFTYQQIESELTASRMLLGSVLQTVQRMIADGDTGKLQNYINVISEYIISGESGLKNINGIYGYFETLDGGRFIYSDNIDWVPPADFAPTKYSWYKESIIHRSAIIETEPYIDYMTGKYIITYARAIHDTGGGRIGIVCIDVSLDKIGEIVTNAALSDSGYGALAAQDLTIFAHTNPDFTGKRMYEDELPLSKYADDIVQGKELYEQPMRSWNGEDVIVFSRTLPNGWHLVLMSPKNQYYRGTTQMLAVLCALGVFLAFTLIMVLIRIERAKEKAGEESRQKSAFLANMSHEIRTPLNAIIGMTYIGKTAGDEERKDYCLDKIENASQHLLGVINDILDMSKIEANMLELSLEEFSFEKMLQRVISIAGFRAGEKRQKLEVHIDKSIPRMLIGDDQRLAQVITNMLGNAVKFTPEEGYVGLDTRVTGEEDGVYTIRITITDSGIGISEEQRKKIFRAFQQADSGTARKFGGTGLGLAISKNIVEMMGGSVEVVSDIGKGSSFSFTFKAKQGSALTDTPDKEEADYRGIFRGYKILLAEDVEINREIIGALIEPTLLEMDCAENGREAVAKFGQSPEEYDLIVMDVQMPEMDGCEATRKIRALEHPAAKTVPIIAMTANVFKEDIEKCLDAGMNHHVGKPVNIDDFFGVLQKYLLN
ncbi:MAG: ATP-binding protein [Chitinispirillia bacterium]|nr:ATP-binding protein [Chitinispirillia bacterium]MCL2268904.1 ATP-binding protein [Chitinispirillia bacterium]